MAVMDDLGIELLTKVLSHGNFPAVQLCRLSTLSKEWREACSSPCLWEKLELRAPEYAEAGLKRIAKRCGDLKELHVARDPLHPRALSLFYSSGWLEGLNAILSNSGRNLRRLVVSTGCHIYQKDYRSAPFYRQLMRRVAKYSRRLTDLEVYYNAGRCGLQRDVSKWMHHLINGCPSLCSFTFWAPSGECGGMDNKVLASLAKGWPDLRSLDVAGEDITLEGVRSLCQCKRLKSLKLRHVTLGPSKRSEELKGPDDLGTFIPCTGSSPHLESIELTWTYCDVLDLQVLLRMFPTVQSIQVCEGAEPELSDSEEEAMALLERAAVASWDMQQLRLAELKVACSQSPALSRIVTFASR